MKSFKVNDRVMYMSKKIYRISNIETKNFGDEEKRYYALIDDKTENDVLYLPVDNELALKNIRPLLTKEEIDNSICESKNNVFKWNNAYRERAQQYNLLLKENNMSKLLTVVRTLLNKKREFEASKKNLPNVDSSFLNTIMQTINEEFSFVLNIQENEVESYILNKQNN